ncbi:MAG: hypothetical protein HKO90_08960 [Flavobacteriaceae bacterium]|nr:hypothetical protein [Flavobacteriaceae bacterium]
MISTRSILASIFMIMFCMISVEAQGDFATLVKNVNYRADGLNHDLSVTKDTLKLKSDDIIQRVYSVGEHGRAIDLWVNRKQRDIPLTELAKGKYVFVVEQNYLKIVFQVVINRDNRLLELNNVMDSRTTGTTSEVIDEKDPLENALIEEKKLTKEIRKSSIITTELPAYKKYNLTDVNRAGMQSREEARKQRIEELKAKLKKQRKD